MEISKTLLTSSLKGTVVKNPKQEEIGVVEDAAIDAVTGEIVYALVSFGGFMGFGEKYFVFPWSSFYLDTVNDNTIILDVNKDKLKASDGIDKDNWPPQLTDDLIDQLYIYYGYEPYSVIRKKYSGKSGLVDSGEARTFDEAGLRKSGIGRAGIK